MKRDMTGGGVVIAVMAALADVGCPVRVTGLVAAAENAVGGDAMRPGDVRHATTAAAPPRSPTPTPRAGWCWPTRWRTPSPSSTPPSLVDVATLTGAMKVALGQQVGGLLRQRRRARRRAPRGRRRRPASRCGGSRWSRDYEEQARPPRSPTPTTPPAAPGAITAALFLQHFVGRRAVGPPRHRLGRRLARRTASSGPPARPASAPGRC